MATSRSRGISPLPLWAKAEPTWRFWGLYVNVCKTESLYEAYQMAKKNDGAPGIDGVTFDAIEEAGVESFVQQIKDELVSNTYRPMRLRKRYRRTAAKSALFRFLRFVTVWSKDSY
jgi:retron-type reverse transcriptase